MATHEEARRDIREYMETRHTMSPEEREAKFIALAKKYFSPNEPGIMAIRQKCEKFGVPTVFSSMPDEETIKILEAPVNQRILKDPKTWIF